MSKHLRIAAGSAVAAIASSLVWAGGALANPIYMPTITKEIQQQRSAAALNPPPPPCPQYPTESCTPLPETPATSLPFPGNMAYYGGHVQVGPKEYVVFWGWGQAGAWPKGTKCKAEAIAEGKFTATLPCDPDGAGKYVADFVQQMGGTTWAGVQTQYYETTSAGKTTARHEPDRAARGHLGRQHRRQHAAQDLEQQQGGLDEHATELGREAQAGVRHFGITDLADSNVVIVQPPGLSDPNALSQGYCAFHDYVYPGVESDVYNGLGSGIEYSNIPYQLVRSTRMAANVCGENAVNSDARGKLDGFSIVTGHEMEETVTDPGAEDVVGDQPLDYLGGWYDTLDGNENGDKCAWVGENLATGQGPPEPIPGAIGDIKGNAGSRFAVQALWSNAANEGTGYCAGAGTDSPIPSSGS